MEFSFSNKRWLTQAEINSDEEIIQKNALGLHIPGMWDKVLDLKECHLQKRPSNEIRLRLKQYADKKGYSFFDPHEQNGLLRNIMIRTSQTDQVMVVVQFCDDKPEQIRDIMEFLSNEFPQITSLQYIINQKKNDSIYDQQVHLYKGNDHIIEKMQDLEFQIKPKSFYQTNSVQAENLYSRLKKLLDLKGDELLFDLYSGIGSIALSLAKNCRKIIGVEVIEDAVKDANENALLNNISNVSFFTGETQDVLAGYYSS
jgi:23S rRNA (uracil1939-C5)-methyltransferase